MLSTFAPAPTAAAPAILFERIGFLEWQPQKGDSFMVDTKNNIGYLVHTDGRYYKFDVVTGQRRGVCYIGRCYFAATPNWEWRAKSMDIKGDRITFGPTGRFVRLYKDGTENTAYGIHEYKYEDKMFSENERFGSMGCVIVRKKIMDVIEETFNVNDGDFEVITKHGIAPAMFVWN